jgi:hypothetical protein
MRLVDAFWALPVNRLWVICDCGEILGHPSNVSLVTCPTCRRAEFWHGVDPKPSSGPWSEPVMAMPWEQA